MRRRFTLSSLPFSVLLIFSLFTALIANLFGQEVLTNQSVIKMVKAGLSEELILNVVKQQTSAFSTNSVEPTENALVCCFTTFRISSSLKPAFTILMTDWLVSTS